MKDKAKILIVEDEGIQAMGLEETLYNAGFEVTGIADNGKDALDMISKEAVDLVIMDIHIKGEMDGIDTAWKIRALSNDLPIIYLTAYVDQDTVKRAEATSPAAYITKPYRHLQLLNSIQDAINKAHKTG